MSNSVIKPQWEEENSQDFIDYGKYFVPDRKSQIHCICELIPRPSKLAHILDLCCGEGLLTRVLLDKFPECQVHGLDGSPKMIARIKRALAVYGKCFEAMQFDLAASDWRQFPWPVHAVVSSLAIHHLDDTEKQALFKDMVSLLTPGGTFIIADLIQPVTHRGKRFAAKAWNGAVRQRSLNLDGNLRAYDYFGEIHWNLYSYQEPDSIDKPSPLFDQLKWLDQAGFTDIDVFWMKAGHAIFGGRKPNT
jgi:tRNA (cmo5U34)-methyltransferase